MEKILSYDDFYSQFYDECKRADWFPEVLEACCNLDTDDLTVSALIGEIHEGLRIHYDEAIKYFWTIFLINPLIAIKAYQETNLLLGKLDIYAAFKHINPMDPIMGQPKTEASGIYNPSVEYFLIFSMEALLQREMNPEVLDVINRNYLGNLYDHDKEVMSNKTKYDNKGIHPPAKWINHRNLNHILRAIDPHHIIVLLEFFADKYGARLYKGNVGKYCYSKDKYEYIIRYIRDRYGSLSEYIEWDNPNYFYHYERYYLRALDFEEMYRYMDIVFPTQNDKERIALYTGVDVNDLGHRNRRLSNRMKNLR